MEPNDFRWAEEEKSLTDLSANGRRKVKGVDRKLLDTKYWAAKRITRLILLNALRKLG